MADKGKEALPSPLPKHVAIIMDGNGRWARARRLPRQAGHAAGIAAVRGVVQAADEIGLGYITLYAFSTENWRRPQGEVANLMGLFRTYFRDDIERLRADNVRVRIIGARGGLDKDILAMIEEAENLTAVCTGLNLTFAFNYSGREELVAAARAIARAGANRKLDPEMVTPEIFAAHLQTAGLPDPDLVIRTSGEKRISNFLLWQAAYAELVFTDTLWPDFGQHDLAMALEEFAQRERRFGGLADAEADAPVQAAGSKP